MGQPISQKATPQLQCGFFFRFGKADASLKRYSSFPVSILPRRKIMKCPYCSSPDTKVTDSRDTDDGASIRRRRQCLSCGRRFTTYETVESLPMVVIKKDGSRQSFDRSKILRGIQRSCEKRPVPVADMERMASEIEQELQNSLEREVSTVVIGEKVMEKLKKADEVAYVRFASVYRQFKDINTFMSELNKLLSEK